MNTPTEDPTSDPEYVSSDSIVSEFWRTLKRTACEEALVRQLRHDKASRRHLFPKQFGPFGEER